MNQRGAINWVIVIVVFIAAGLLLKAYSWSSVFFVNVPIAALTLVAVALLVPTSRDPEGHPLDWPGSFLSLIGLIALFYDAKIRWAWIVTWIGLAIIVIEILSRIRFLITIKTSHLIIMFVTFAAGAGLMLQSYRANRAEASAEEKKDEEQKDEPS